MTSPTQTENTVTLNSNQLITTAVAAMLLSIPAATLTKWRSTGLVDIPYIKIGHGVRYSTADLKAWVESNTQNKLGGEI